MLKTSTIKAFAFGLLTLAAACGGTSGPNDPCDGAPSGTACLWAGTGDKGFNAENPTADRLSSKLYFPSDLTFGPDGRAYISDWNNHKIRRVEADDSMTVIVGTDYEGDGSPQMEDRLPQCSPAGALGTTVAMNHPSDVKFGPDGLLYIAAWHNNKIRIYDPATGMVTADGNGYGFVGDGGPACAALFNQPKTMVFDTDGTMYTLDQRNVRIRKITPAPSSMVTTIAGDGKLGNIGDGGPAITAEFGFEKIDTPRLSGGLALNGRSLYVADSLNNRIRRINLDTGMIDCIAGVSGTAGYSGDGGPAMRAQFNFPDDLEMGPDGNLYVAERYNHAVRKIDLTTGIVSTVVGNGTSCSTDAGTCSDVAKATSMQLNEPYGISFDGAGNLYVADTNNSRILKVIK